MNFSKNKTFFDVIFIDGLHHYKQCQKDCINALKFLKANGIILLHDYYCRMLMRNLFRRGIKLGQVMFGR